MSANTWRVCQSCFKCVTVRKGTLKCPRCGKWLRGKRIRIVRRAPEIERWEDNRQKMREAREVEDRRRAREHEAKWKERQNGA